MATHAPEFRKGGCIKEFIDDEGKTYLVVCFPDNSVGVYQRKRGTGKAAADYKPASNQKKILLRLGATGEKNTYTLGRKLCGR